jgi:hypothetical protein
MARDDCCQSRTAISYIVVDLNRKDSSIAASCFGLAHRQTQRIEHLSSSWLSVKLRSSMRSTINKAALGKSGGYSASFRFDNETLLIGREDAIRILEVRSFGAALRADQRFKQTLSRVPMFACLVLGSLRPLRVPASTCRLITVYATASTRCRR